MTAVKETIQHLVEKYRCDPNDPLFAILEKLDEYHSDVKENALCSLDVEQEALKKLIEMFDGKTQTLQEAALKLSDSNRVFEENARIVAESTHALVRYWKQIQLRHALIGMLVSSVVFGGLFGIFYLQSSDRLLKNAHVAVLVEKTERGTKVSLSGKKLGTSGKSDTELVGEFLH